MKNLRLIGALSLMILGAIAPVMAFAGEWKGGAAVRTVWEAVQNGISGYSGNVGMEGEEDMAAVVIQVGDREFPATLLDNRSTQALLERFPMTVTMNEMNGNEKYYDLPSGLPTDTRSVGSIHAGDIMLYGSDCLVLFYEDFRTSYQYTRLGSISKPEGLSEALGSGSVQVTFRVEER